jgi:hypothetical protein
MIENYINRVAAAIDNAMNDVTKLPQSVFTIPGMSSRENRILLNELIKEYDKYLEIGVHKGSTFVSAMYNNNATAVAIDNFSQFGNYEENKRWFDQSCNEHNISNFTFINADCFNLSEEQKEIVKGTNVYFYDGDHRAEDQENALTYYLDVLTNQFIFIVDDWNHEPAKEGTRIGLSKCGLKIHKEWTLTNHTTSKNWHNGLYVAVLEKT